MSEKDFRVNWDKWELDHARNFYEWFWILSKQKFIKVLDRLCKVFGYE